MMGSPSDVRDARTPKRLASGHGGHSVEETLTSTGSVYNPTTRILFVIINR
jgi:hypothetical protein